MASFYSGNVMPSVCGKTVKVYHSQSYPTIQVRLGLIKESLPQNSNLLLIYPPSDHSRCLRVCFLFIFFLLLFSRAVKKIFSYNCAPC